MRTVEDPGLLTHLQLAVDNPVVEPNCPAAHNVHTLAPGWLENLPAGQGAPVGAVMPTLQYDPAGAEQAPVQAAVDNPAVEPYLRHHDQLARHQVAAQS